MKRTMKIDEEISHRIRPAFRNDQNHQQNDQNNWHIDAFRTKIMEFDTKHRITIKYHQYIELSMSHRHDDENIDAQCYRCDDHKTTEPRSKRTKFLRHLYAFSRRITMKLCTIRRIFLVVSMLMVNDGGYRVCDTFAWLWRNLLEFRTSMFDTKHRWVDKFHRFVYQTSSLRARNHRSPSLII